MLEVPMLLRGLTWLVLFQLLGTGLNVLLLPMLPGPIIGLVLLFGYFLARGEVGKPVNGQPARCCATCRCCWCRRRSG